MRCEIFVSKSDALKNFILKSDHNWDVFSEIWFLSCFLGSDWMMIFSVNLNANLFQRGELKDNACFGFSLQMYNWKLPHINSSLNVWGVAIWQHSFFKEVTDGTLWSIKCSRSTVFLKIHLCKNKRKRSLIRVSSFFSNVFVWARRRRAMGRSWLLHSIYPILPAACYLSKSWRLSKLTMLNRKMNFKTCVAQNIP